MIFNIMNNIIEYLKKIYLTIPNSLSLKKNNNNNENIIITASQVNKLKKITELQLPKNTIDLSDEHLNTLYDIFILKNKTLDELQKIKENNEYDNIIENIVKEHKNGRFLHLRWNPKNENLVNNIIKYIELNKNHINHILLKNGYSFYTCSNYHPLDEIISIIKGEPYYQYLFNEGDDNYKKIEVIYYINNLKSLVTYSKCLMYGMNPQISFNALTGSLKVLNNDQIKLVLSHTYVSNYGKTISIYDIKMK